MFKFINYRFIFFNCEFQDFEMIIQEIADVILGRMITFISFSQKRKAGLFMEKLINQNKLKARSFETGLFIQQGGLVVYNYFLLYHICSIQTHAQHIDAGS